METHQLLTRLIKRVGNNGSGAFEHFGITLEDEPGTPPVQRPFEGSTESIWPTKIETPAFPHPPGTPYFRLNERYKRFKLTVVGQTKPETLAGQKLLPEGTIYLFNVIVALEWQPTARTIDELMRALSATSDVIYDATNGAMAFGQVVFTSRKYLEQADIQILASNRFHPRSMVRGLTDSQKFSPIRLGRGIWRKDRHILLPWDENTGYRAIAHEWAHYALGLHDEYIDDTLRVKALGKYLVEDRAWGVPIVMPRISVAQHTLMETLDADELVPLQRKLPPETEGEPDEIARLRQRMLNRIEELYPGITEKLLSGNPGPSGFPVALPCFFHTDDLTIDGTEELPHAVTQIGLDNCWLYSYRYTPGDGGQGEALRITGQGCIEDHAKVAKSNGQASRAAFEFLGAQQGDQLLAVGLNMPQRQDGQPMPRGTVELKHAALADNQSWTRQDTSGMPVIAVLPSSERLTWPEMRVQVHVAGGSRPEPSKVWLASPGADAVELSERQADPRIYGGRQTDDQQIKHMDGTVALQWGEAAERKLWIGEFSYGGNPPTTVRSPGAPISAGSSDGNLMIFSALDNVPQPGSEDKDDYKTCIVTTRNYAGFEENAPGRPAGYLFSVAANMALDTARFHPTIVMYYDNDGLDDESDLVIYRYDEQRGEWQPLPTYLPAGSYYAATPINNATAPNLVLDPAPLGLRVEYYRLFSVAK